MGLKNSEIKVIEKFFDNKSLSKCFIDLFNYQKELCDEIQFVDRNAIIGFGCEGEHLRAYVGKNKDGFYLKPKTQNESIPFIAKNIKELKRNLLLNNIVFYLDKDKYILQQTIQTPLKSTSKKVSSESIEKKNSVLSKLKNRNCARKFTVDDFYDLADWSYCTSFTEESRVYRLPNGNKIECDSKSELTFLKYLISKKLTYEIGAQNLCIQYDTAYRSNVDYYPDFVILTKDYHIECTNFVLQFHK